MIKSELRTPAWTRQLPINLKQQPKSSLKARYKSKTRFQNMNLIKKLKKLNQNTKIEQKSIKKSQLGLRPGCKSKCSPETSKTKIKLRIPNIANLLIKSELRTPAWTR